MFNLAVKNSQNADKKGTYPIRYSVGYDQYPFNVELSQVFTITILDPCDQPTSIIGPSLVDQEYTLTDNAVSYQIEPFITEPTWCAVTYRFEIEHFSGKDAVAFDDDHLAREFTFHYVDGLALSGLGSQDFEVTVTGELGDGTMSAKVQAQSKFTLTLKNPCIDPGFVTIQQAILRN